jgi:hypothetical protein
MTVPDYILRNIDPKLWQQFKQRAESEGRSLRWLLLEFIKAYIKKGLN